MTLNNVRQQIEYDIIRFIRADCSNQIENSLRLLVFNNVWERVANRISDTCCSEIINEIEELIDSP